MKSKYLLIVLATIFLISFTSATITVSLPANVSENMTTTMQGGGTLDINETYYYTVIGYDGTYYSPSSYTRFGFHSPLSEEMNFTTNDTHRSAYITWDGGSGCSHYNILLTKTSGDYTDSGGFDTNLENIGTMTTEYYNVTAENNGIYVIHSANLVNNLSYEMNKTFGIVKVYVDGSIGVDLEDIYDAMVSQGFEDYVFYDGYHFALKGWIVVDGSSATSIIVTRKDITFIKGGLHVNNPSATVQFGTWVDDYQKASYTNGVNINLQNGRYPFRACTGCTLNVYGSRLTTSNNEGLQTSETENLVGSYYIGGQQLYLAYDISGIKDLILGTNVRSVTSEVRDLKTGIGNNWFNENAYRMTITGNRNSCYSYECQIYDTTWVKDMLAGEGFKIYCPATGASYSTWIFDPYFPQLEYNNNIPPVFYFATSYGTLVNDAYFQFHNSIIAKVINSTGQIQEDVKVYLTNSTGDPMTWIEHEGGIDRTITGNKYSLNVSTDENGTIDYYVYSYNVTLNQSNTIADSYNDNYVFTPSYPYYLTFEKEGYKNQTIYLETITDKTNLLVSLEALPSWNYSDVPEWKILNDTKHTILKINSDGDLAIAGQLYENTNSPPPGVNILWSWNNILWLDDFGNLYLNKLLELII